MGAFTGEAKTAQIEAIREKAKFCTVASAIHFAPEESAVGKVIKLIGSEAKGYTTGLPFMFTEINGIKIEPSGENEGRVVAGLTLGHVYWIVAAAANQFEIAFEKGGVGVAFTEILKATSQMYAIKEHTGAKTKRIATGFGAAANGSSEDAVAREVVISSTTTIEFTMYWSQEAVGGTLYGINKVTAKTLEENDVYKITKGILEENAAA